MRELTPIFLRLNKSTNGRAGERSGACNVCKPIVYFKYAALLSFLYQIKICKHESNVIFYGSIGNYFVCV